MTLRSAVVWSALVHVWLFSIRPPLGLVPPRQVLRSLEVNYLIAQNNPPSTNLNLRENTLARSLETAQIRRSEPADSKPASMNEHPAERPIPDTFEQKATQSGKREHPIENEQEVIPKRQVMLNEPRGSAFPPKGAATSLPEGEFAVLQHKQMIRHHLKRYLTYPAVRLQGVVYLQIDLDPDGKLRDAVVREASDPRLEEITLNGVRSAAPYPPFPRELKSSSARYEFLVQYRWE